MNNYINPNSLSIANPTRTDPVYGVPKYSWSNSGGSATLDAYQDQGGSWIYGLQSNNGWNGSPDGGANLFLSADVAPVTLDHTVNYSVDLRITAANVSGGGYAFLNTGFTFDFHDPTGASPDSYIFVQIPITHSQGQAATNYYSLSPSGGGSIAQGLLEGSADPYFAFAPQSQTQDVQYSSINLYLQQAIAKLGLPAAETNLADWTIGSVYVGTEVGGPATATAKVGVEISHLSLTETDAAPSEQVPADPTQFSGNSSDYAITVNANHFTIAEKGVAGTARNLADGSGAHFADGTATIDTTGSYAHLIPFFKAAFGTLPSAAEMASVQAVVGTSTPDNVLGSEFLGLSGLESAGGGLSAQALQQLYIRVTGAPATAATLNNAALSTTNSAASGQFLATLTESAQAQAQVVGYVAPGSDPTSATISGVILVSQGTAATPDVVSAFKNVAALGVTMTAIAQGFVSQASLSSLSNGQFVATLFEHLRGTDPDPQTMASWTNILGSGLSRADALVAIGNSSETQAKLHSGAPGGWVLTQ